MIRTKAPPKRLGLVGFSSGGSCEELLEFSVQPDSPKPCWGVVHLVLWALKRRSLTLECFTAALTAGVQPLSKEQGHTHAMSSNLPLSFWTPEGYHWPCGACSGEHREAGRWAKTGRGTLTKAEIQGGGPLLICSLQFPQKLCKRVWADPANPELLQARDSGYGVGLGWRLRTEQSQSGTP